MDVAVEISGGGSAKQADECVKALVQAVDGLDMEDVLDDPTASASIQTDHTDLSGKIDAKTKK